MDDAEIDLFCPHCKAPLIVRCYYERWVDFGAYVYKDILDVDMDAHHDDSEHFSGGEMDDFTNYECASCKGSLKEYIGMSIKDLPANMKGGDDK